MNEKQFALKIKRELIECNTAFCEEKDFISAEIPKNIDDLQGKGFNITKLIEECNKIKINVFFGNKTKTNKNFYYKQWKKAPFIIFTFSSDL